MNKWRSLLVAGVLVNGSLLFATDSMNQRGIVYGDDLTVNVKNPDARTTSGESAFEELEYDDECQIAYGSEYTAMAHHGGKVLVRLYANKQKLLREGYTPCPAGTVFWRSEQEFRMAAQAYRRHVAKKAQQENERQLIRRLLSLPKSASH